MVVFDNDTSELDPIGDERAHMHPSTTVPDTDAPFLMVRIHTNTRAQAVEVFLHRRGKGYQVVGIDREM